MSFCFIQVAQWLLEPSQREKNLFGITKQWLSEEYITLTEGFSFFLKYVYLILDS